MSSARTAALLAALSNGPASTSALYDSVGYLTLTRLGFVPYHAFRDELVRMAAAGLVIGEPGTDGSTIWRLSPPAEAPEP
jgi:hypothetical protein